MEFTQTFPQLYLLLINYICYFFSIVVHTRFKWLIYGSIFFVLQIIFCHLRNCRTRTNKSENLV